MISSRIGQLAGIERNAGEGRRLTVENESWRENLSVAQQHAVPSDEKKFAVRIGSEISLHDQLCSACRIDDDTGGCSVGWYLRQIVSRCTSIRIGGETLLNHLKIEGGTNGGFDRQ